MPPKKTNKKVSRVSQKSAALQPTQVKQETRSSTERSSGASQSKRKADAIEVSEDPPETSAAPAKKAARTSYPNGLQQELRASGGDSQGTNGNLATVLDNTKLHAIS